MIIYKYRHDNEYLNRLENSTACACVCHTTRWVYTLATLGAVTQRAALRARRDYPSAVVTHHRRGAGHSKGGGRLLLGFWN